mmetsp:Transcript_9112/g.23202  ORF Transcript_9112/g.23202 Transcript_9112/m.23202 type:complete len:270 (-) Transcript_9112:519-1328(-)
MRRKRLNVSVRMPGFHLVNSHSAIFLASLGHILVRLYERRCERHRHLLLLLHLLVLHALCHLRTHLFLRQLLATGPGLGRRRAARCHLGSRRRRPARRGARAALKCGRLLVHRLENVQQAVSELLLLPTSPLCRTCRLHGGCPRRKLVAKQRNDASVLSKRRAQLCQAQVQVRASRDVQKRVVAHELAQRHDARTKKRARRVAWSWATSRQCLYKCLALRQHVRVELRLVVLRGCHSLAELLCGVAVTAVSRARRPGANLGCTGGGGCR